MANITKRGGGYRVQVRRKGFPPESATFRVRAQAVEWAATREAELIGSRHGIIPRRTVREAIVRYRDTVSPTHRGERWERIRLNKLLREINFADKLLTHVAPSDLAAWRDAALTRLAPSSVRREYGLVRAVFAIATKEWGWLRESPFARVKAPAGGDVRTRRVSDFEANAIIMALGYRRGRRPESSSQFVAAAFLLALETMMRKGELLSLTRAQINAPASFLSLPRTKNGDARDVPLSPAALALLDLLVGTTAVHSAEQGEFVGTNAPQTPLFPISAGVCDTLFRRAVKAAGISDLHFHDARREATTRLAKKLDVLQLAKAGGWRDVNMLLKIYYAPSASDAAARLR